MNINRNFRDHMVWRANIIALTFIPALLFVMCAAWFVLTYENTSIILAELFVLIAFCGGYAMASFKVDNADGILARAGDMELEKWKTLIDMEIAYRSERKNPLLPRGRSA